MAEHVNGKAPGARKPAAKRPAAKRPPGKRAAAKPAVKPAVVKRVPKLKPVLLAASKPAPELELARAAVRVIEDKLGDDILLLDLQGISSFTDYFVIASAKGERQLKAIANAVLDVAKAKRRNVAHNLDAQSAGGSMAISRFKRCSISASDSRFLRSKRRLNTSLLAVTTGLP